MTTAGGRPILDGLAIRTSKYLRKRRPYSVDVITLVQGKMLLKTLLGGTGEDSKDGLTG